MENKKQKVKWNVSKTHNLYSAHGLNIEDKVVKALAEELKNEIDKEIIFALTLKMGDIIELKDGTICRIINMEDIIEVEDLDYKIFNINVSDIEDYATSPVAIAKMRMRNEN